MKKLCWLLLIIGFNVQAEERISEELLFDGVDTELFQLDDLPRELLEQRELPWIITAISKPGMFLFLKTCAIIDWFKHRSLNCYRYMIYHLRGRSVKSSELVPQSQE